MKKSLYFFLIMLAVGIIAVGCGGADESEETDNSSIETLITEEETVMGFQKEDELKIPIYPGSEYEEDSFESVPLADDGSSLGSVSARFKTTDQFKKVTDWYSQELGEPDYIDEESASWMRTGLVNSDTSLVTMRVDGSKVIIDLSRVIKE